MCPLNTDLAHRYTHIHTYTYTYKHTNVHISCVDTVEFLHLLLLLYFYTFVFFFTLIYLILIISAVFIQLSQMDNPHGPVRITALSFAGAGSGGAMLQKNAVMCATASVDGTVKVWR